MSFSALEHEVIAYFKENFDSLENKVVMVGCSSGLDSSVLFNICYKILPIFKYKLKLLHFHHGRDLLENKKQSLYRDKAEKFCSDLAQRKKVDFELVKAPLFLKTEEECREFRLNYYKKTNKKVLLFLGQHKDDFIETLLLRLIRGTGVNGFVEPFSNKNLYRPFLKTVSRKKLENYAVENSLECLEDPSNKESDFLRNWVRNKWLKDLEDKVGKEGLTKSLSMLSEGYREEKNTINEINLKFEGAGGEACLLNWEGLTSAEKKRLIFKVISTLKGKNYTSGQVVEIVKMINHPMQSRKFCISNVLWFKEGVRLRFSLVKE